MHKSCPYSTSDRERNKHGRFSARATSYCLTALLFDELLRRSHFCFLFVYVDAANPLDLSFLVVACSLMQYRSTTVRHGPESDSHCLLLVDVFLHELVTYNDPMADNKRRIDSEASTCVIASSFDSFVMCRGVAFEPSNNSSIGFDGYSNSSLCKSYSSSYVHTSVCLFDLRQR
jgi:hypothetical protein